MKLLVFLSIFVIFATESLAVENFCLDNNIQLGVFPHPELAKCDFYIICVFTRTIIEQCDEGTIFVPQLGSNPSSGSCEPGYAETCTLATEPPTTTTTTEAPTTVTESTTITEIESTTFSLPGAETSTTVYPIETTTSSGGSLPDDICKGHYFRYIPYPNVCWKYILCAFERPHIGECESHQIFHQTLNFCTRGNRETCRPCIFFC